MTARTEYLRGYYLANREEILARRATARNAAGRVPRDCVGACGRTMILRGHQTRWCCEDCRPARRAAAVARHAPKRRGGRARTLWDVHRLTVDEYEALFDAQDGRCAGCHRRSLPLHIDHKHGCSEHRRARTCGLCRRGLLCADCNHTLGMAGDSPTTLRALAAYLEGGPL